MAFFLAGKGFACMMPGRQEEALDAGERSIPLQPGRVTGYRVLIGALYALGRVEHARDAARRYAEASPVGARVFADRVRYLFADTHFTEHLIEALRAAGLPE
jgi:hypothetical protein